jgi:hypothetical protein
MVGVWEAGTLRAKIVVADDPAPDTYYDDLESCDGNPHKGTVR